MRGMAKLLVVGLLLTGASSMAAADTSDCKPAVAGSGWDWGFSGIEVKESGAFWKYVVSVSGPKWQREPFGYHAPGALICEACSAWGLYYHRLASSKEKPPATAAERGQRRSEVFGYPHWMLGPADLEPEASREGITVGPLKGYAVRYALKIPPEKMPKRDDGKKLGLLAVSLTDGCITFEPTLLIPAGEGWAVLDSLLQELAIERKPSSEVQPPMPPWKEKTKDAN